MMQERVEISGRGGMATYVDKDFNPVEKEACAYIKVLFDDGEQLIGAVEKDDAEPVEYAADWDESKHPRHPAGDDQGGEFAPSDISKHADAIAAMPEKIRDNTELGDFPGGPDAYNLYEARKLLSKPSDKLKKVTDSNSFSLWQDYSHIANVTGVHFGISKYEDPDDPDDDSKFVFAFRRLDRGRRGSMTETTTYDVPELFGEMRKHL